MMQAQATVSGHVAQTELTSWDQRQFTYTSSLPVALCSDLLCSVAVAEQPASPSHSGESDPGVVGSTPLEHMSKLDRSEWLGGR